MEKIQYEEMLSGSWGGSCGGGGATGDVGVVGASVVGVGACSAAASVGAFVAKAHASTSLLL